MDLLTAIEISARGLSAERTRVNVASMNLANAHVTKTLDGGPYRAKDVVFQTVPLDKVRGGADANGVKRGGGRDSYPFERILQDELKALEVVKVAKIVDSKEPFKEVYDPSHPDADSRGIVRLPNVNVIEEMVDLMNAQRAYEAGVSAMNTAKQMALKALEIGR